LVLLPFAVGVLLLAGAMLAASETALFALMRMERTRERLSGKVRTALDRLLARPFESVVVIIGLNEIANVFAGSLATSFLLRLFGMRGAAIAVPVMFSVVLVFVEITPKTLALGFPDWIARITAKPLAFIARLAHPIAQVFVPAEAAGGPEPVSESEFKALLRAGEHQGVVEAAERELIHKVFDFGNRRVGNVMTPRERIFSLDINTPPEQIMPAVTAAHFSRVPIFRNDPGNIVGVLHVKDLVARRLDGAAPRLDRLIRPPYFVPDRKPVSELVEEMRRDRVHLAIVVGEYGDLRGLVSLEDLLEELFGEIKDEFDIEGPELAKSGDHEWLVSGGIELARLQEALGSDQLPKMDGPDRTLSRLLLRRLRRVPWPGEQIELGAYHATVERVRGAHIEQVRLSR
jgi:putative hemolysin